MLVKEKFHKLIDQIKDEKALEGYLNLILKLNTHQSGKLYSKLSKEQKDELGLAYTESFDDTQLTSNEDIKNQYDKWL
jgi:hypothetical protein